MRHASSDGVLLRMMDCADLDQVVALERSCFGDPWPRESFQAELADAPRVRWPLVAFRGGSLAGYVIGWFIEDEAHLANLAVAPALRRRGLGRRLLAALLAEASRRGSRWILLEVRPSNLAALSLYGEFGFRPVGRRRAYYADTQEDALVMQLELREESTP